MKKNTKTFLVALVTCLFSVTISAHDFEVDGIYYNILSQTDKTVEVTYQGTGSYSSVYTGSITIPSSVVYNNTTFSVVGIGGNAFYGCFSLKSILIGNSVKSIGQRAFSFCPILTSICVDESNPKYDSRNNCNAIIEKGTNTLITGCINTTIPNTVTSIGSSAFEGRSSLGSIGIPNSVTSIGDRAFSQCSGLTSIEIPNSVTNIGTGAFTACKNLISIVIPNSVTRIEDDVFSDCYGLTRINIPNSVTSIGDGAFYLCKNLTDVYIPNSVTSIGENAFYQCSGLTSLEIPNSVTSIGDGAFTGCKNLINIELGNSVTSIGRYAFSGCDNLRSIGIPNSVTSIGISAFTTCDNLISIELGNSVTSIGDGAFSQCYNIVSIACKNPTPPICEALVFDGIPTSCKLIVPASSVDSYSSTAPWSSFTNIEAMPTSEIILRDGEAYNNSTEEVYDKITYTRTLPNLMWNCLYVPFEVPYEDLAENYDVAYINNMNSYDTDENGEIDKLTMEWIKIKQGTLKANYPYLIKAKNEDAKNMTLVQENAILYPAESITLDCNSIYTNFEITGTYQPISEEDMNGRLAISLNGIWEPSTGLKANRFYLTITERGDAPVKITEAALSRISNIIIGDDSATGIEDAVQEATRQSGATYDLSGRRVQNPAKGGVYIVNGKKVVF